MAPAPLFGLLLSLLGVGGLPEIVKIGEGIYLMLMQFVGCSQD